MSDQTAFACNLYCAVTEQFHRITVLTGRAGKYSDDRSFGVVAKRLIDLVTNYKFLSHGDSFCHQDRSEAERICATLMICERLDKLKVKEAANQDDLIRGE